MYVQSHGYFVLLVIGNVNIPFPNPLVVTALQNLLINTWVGGVFYDMVLLYMITKSIEGSITKASLKKLRLRRREYEWADAWGIIMNDGSTMICLIFKASTQMQGLIFQT